MAAKVYRPIICPGCRADDTTGAENTQGAWYMRCLRCSLRFWYLPRR